MKELVDAAVIGVHRAGFIDVVGEYDTAKEMIVVTGACPCGLGKSRFAFCRYGTFKHYVQQTAENLQWEAYTIARSHIERDRAEGRWKD
jgi:hypothetical protein